MLTARQVWVDASNSVNIRRYTGSFESLADAPTSGYVVDSLLTIVPGGTVVVQAPSPLCAAAEVPTIFAKIRVDVLDRGQRALRLVTTLNPNCAGLSFEE